MESDFPFQFTEPLRFFDCAPLYTDNLHVSDNKVSTAPTSTMCDFDFPYFGDEMMTINNNNDCSWMNIQQPQGGQATSQLLAFGAETSSRQFNTVENTFHAGGYDLLSSRNDVNVEPMFVSSDFSIPNVDSSISITCPFPEPVSEFPTAFHDEENDVEEVQQGQGVSYEDVYSDHSFVEIEQRTSPKEHTFQSFSNAAQTRRDSVVSQSDQSRAETTWEKRLRHKQVEVDRRRKMNDKFTELQKICSTRKDKGSVLEGTVKKLKQIQTQHRELELRLAALKQKAQLKAQEQKHCDAPFSWSPQGMTYSGDFISKSPLDSSEDNWTLDTCASQSSDHSVSIKDCSAGMALVSPSGQFAQCNEAMSMILGYPKSVLTSTTLFAITNPEHLTNVFGNFQRLMSKEMDSCSFAAGFLSSRGDIIQGHCVLSNTEAESDFSTTKSRYMLLILIPSTYN